MSYVIPSVEVYQQLQSSGGVTNATPDLEVCLIGPAYNVLSYVAGSTSSLINTAAISSVSATGSTTVGSTVLVLTTQSPFFVGDTVIIPGAGASGATMSGNVVSVSGYNVTLDTAASTAVSNVLVSKTGAIGNGQVQNTFNLPGQKPGQVIDPTTVQVYLNNAYVETLATIFTGNTGSNIINIGAATSPASATSGSAQLTGVTAAAKFVIGDPVSVSGAGVSGAALTTTIIAISGTTVTLATAAGTTAANATMTKTAISNVNPATSTLRVEAGDKVVMSYTNVNNVAQTFTSTVSSVTTLTGTLSSLTLADMLPVGLSQTTTISVAAASAATVINVASTTGFALNDQLIVRGGGLNGADLYATVTAIGTGPASLTISPALGSAVTVGTSVVRIAPVVLRTRKLYNNQLLAQSYNSHQNYDTSATATTGQIVIEPMPAIVYGTVITANVNLAYKALRTDLSNRVITISTAGDITGLLGDTSDANPLGLAATICMANTTTQINVIAVSSNDLLGYTGALEVAEGQRLYALVPLTQEQDILAAFQAHADQLSVPTMAAWRIALVNTTIPTTQNIGPYSSNFVNANGGNNTITIVNGAYVLTASNATFMSDGVTPGDSIVVTAATGSPTQVGSLQVQQVLSNQQVVVAATGTATAVSYYVSRKLSKSQQAAAIAAVSTTFNDQRVIHVQPDTVGVTVNGVVKYLPGYYLCAALGGMVAGFPVQQGFTNVGVAGIADLKFSNFYFTRAQMNTIAGAGTFLFVQETQGSIPYVRHELTTNMSVLEYRELLVVKNWDWLSYAYYDVLKGFIGKWNITPDTLNTIRQTIVSASELYKGQKLPKIGAPLLSYKIASLAQDPNNKDTLIINLNISVVYPLNYINLYLII